MANLSPTFAAQFLARHLFGNPRDGVYVREKLVPDFMPAGNEGEFLKRCMERVDKGVFLTVGDVEDVASSIARPFLVSMKMNASDEARSSIDRYLAVLHEYAEEQSFRQSLSYAEVSLKNGEPLANVKTAMATSMAKATTATRLQTLGSFAEEAASMFQQGFSGHRPGSSFGFGKRLDNLMWQDPKALSVIGARPGGNKTSFAVKSMITTATPEHPVAFFSMEMPGYAIAQRMACMIAGVNMSDALKGRVTSSEQSLLLRILKDLQHGHGIYIDDGMSSMAEVRYKILGMENRPSSVWIDFAGLVDVSMIAGTEPTQKGSIYRDGKQIAKDVGTHVVVLTQLQEGVDKRESKWPVQSDVAETSKALQAADYLAFLMTPEYYSDRGMECRLLADEDIAGVTYVIGAKSRNGQVGIVKLAWKKESMTLSEMEDGIAVEGVKVYERVGDAGANVAEMEGE